MRDHDIDRIVSASMILMSKKGALLREEFRIDGIPIHCKVF